MKLRIAQDVTKIPTAIIKSKRNKVVQAIDRADSLYYVVKIMSFYSLEEFLWFEKDVGERLDVLKRINGLGIIEIIEKGICTIQVKETGSQWTVYLTRREVIGPTLQKILEKENLVIHILMDKDLKNLIWNIFALMIAGGGYPTLITTLENLIFEEVGQKYKPTLNYFSFIATRLLKFNKDIERDQFLQIGMFLDEQALESGNIDRFQFKCKNFAIIVLSLLVRRNPNHFIFYNVELPNAISKEKAKQVYGSVIKPRIKEILGFQTLKNTFTLLNIPGLQNFIHSALGFQSQDQPAEDWGMIQRMLLEQKEEGKFQGREDEEKIGKILWEKESEEAKKVLQRKGLGLGKNGTRIYMAFKISVHLECLLQFNDWKSMMKKLNYNYKTHDLFYRLLQCSAIQDFPSSSSSSSSPSPSALQQATNQLLSLSKQSFKMMGIIDNKKIFTHSHQHTALALYSDLIQ